MPSVTMVSSPLTKASPNNAPPVPWYRNVAVLEFMISLPRDYGRRTASVIDGCPRAGATPTASSAGRACAGPGTSSAQATEPELHGEVGRAPQLDIRARAVPDGHDPAVANLVAPQLALKP